MPTPQSTNENPAVCDPVDAGGGGGAGAPGSRVCTVKIRFEFGKKMPRISCAMLPSGGYTLACAVVVPAASIGFTGQVMVLRASSLDASSVAPARKPPAFKM